MLRKFDNLYAQEVFGRSFMCLIICITVTMTQNYICMPTVYWQVFGVRIRVKY